VAIFVKDIVSAVTIDIPVQFNHIEVVCVDLSFSGVVCRVICFYRRPGFSDTDVSYMIDLVKCLQKLCSTEKLVIVAGDCNLPDIDWTYYHAPNSPVYNTFIDFVNNYGFYQYVNQPTRGDNILDIVMSTSNTFLEDLAVSVPLGTSDHNTIILKTNVSVETTCPRTSMSYFDFEHTDYDAINEYLAVTDWNDIFSHSITVEDSWCLFMHILNDIFVSHVPVKTTGVYTGKPKRKATHYPRYIKQMQKRKAVETLETVWIA